MITVYGINNCDTCRKARRWLRDQGIEHAWHDIRQGGLDAKLVEAWLAAVDKHKLINRRGPSWRKLDEEQQAALNAGKVAPFLDNPTVIKRPVLDTGRQITVGFDADDWHELLKG